MKRKTPRANRKLLTGAGIPEDAHSYRLLRPSFTIYLGSDPSSTQSDDNEVPEPGVDYRMADRFELNLDILSCINPARPILINMHSCGGDWEAGMQIFGAILHCPNPVTVLGTKWCRSMTSLIPLAADRFVMRAPAQYMIHRGSYAFGGPDQLADTNDNERRKSSEMMMRLYISRMRERGRFSRLSERRLRAMIDDGFRKQIDVWLSADEAVDYGFADAVYDGNPRTLRATRKNIKRRAAMESVIRRPINVDIRVT